jgi:hypothetical protein
MKNESIKKHKLIIAVTAVGIAALLGYFAPSSPVKAVETLINYPAIGAEDITWESSLPQIIKYIYLFAVGICGAVALLSILLGAIKYIGASGNPSKMGDAKEQIFSAILGVVILLSSYLILNTINPDLVNLQTQIGGITPVGTSGGRECYCVYEGETFWDATYTTPQECASACNDECRTFFDSAGLCQEFVD